MNFTYRDKAIVCLCHYKVDLQALSMRKILITELLPYRAILYENGVLRKEIKNYI